MRKQSSKGQVELVTAVLLTGIMITFVSAAYFWGLPLIEKQKDRTKLDRVEGFMKDLNTEIKNVASNGGTESITANLPAELTFMDNNPPNRDKITVSFESDGSLIATNQTIELVGQESDGTVPASAEPGLITAFSEKKGEEYEITLTLQYRYLKFENDNKNLIDLNNLGRGKRGGGDVRVTIEDAGDVTYNNSLNINKINVRIE